MIRFICRAMGCAVVAALAAGCGKAPPPPIVPAAGVVTIGGRPVPKAQVRFVPKIDHGPEFTAVGETDDAGRFQLKCNGQDGACACEHVVVITEGEIPAKLLTENAQTELAKYMKALPNRPIPAKYGNLAESGLRATVSADRSEYNFELQR
ncbi:MAG: hypothetical protein J0I06_04290 [Planctomycetes bacterium]|nr:hypothetical protein [Planctomycetota bacterium]